ncbi:5,10-methylenetetrahydrofolate reductase [Streptomyces cinnamoneus]|uniref:Methylenetetrahydrofolate reductase n=1 Tax=Streptomyces cinnamoneus TaxID=53446 RepID=A0A2G1XNP0_STRCJ|nr:methylenetetrahydrofolate reductase [Streptomyces cinnamoneus]PHQ52759.1 5,10-methylenetetrahydrofolate reductase [Streptomyces cinnamoneus]PPT11860.1 methylenetetrahydrofolate reductase [Streptomyces cinnamoneus]
MDSHTASPGGAAGLLLEDFSLEMTGKDGPALEEAGHLLPAGTRVNVTFLGNEEMSTRLTAARAVKALGFEPVPHLSARRMPSRAAFEEFLCRLRADGTSGQVFAVGGDPAVPEGPYEDSLALIRSGLLERYGVQQVGLCGYPEGHPAITGPRLWSALEQKAAALSERGMSGHVVTQFGFDPDPVLRWIEEARDRGVHLPVRVGVPGPAGVRRLLGYAARFGVGTSAGIARKYGLSLTHLMGTAGPDRFLRALSEGYDPQRHGTVKLHFYTFGGLRATAEWAAGFREASPSAS